MMIEIDDTLEQGRAALNLLERQLHDRKDQESLRSDASYDSRQYSITSERKLLDKVPRDERLKLKKSSPLGLTVEELDDRGLLEGGGSLPSYHRSLRQKNRKPLEMRKRSTRIQERGKESGMRVLSSLFHMIRTLSKRGLNLEEYCRDKDQELKGVIDKRHFMYMLKQLRLPFTKKELLEVAQRYTLPSNHYAVAIDYESFIRDAGLAIKSSSMYGNECETLSGNEVVDLSIYSVVLMDVKRMILETARSLNKSHEDFHRMFARWDHEGVGSVTATQFLRVLARLQINLSDNDQDFLIELLDTNGMGRIDFESLLAFCLDDLENTIDNNRSPRFSEKSNFDKDNSLANFDEDVVMKRAVDNDDALKLSWSSHLSHGAPYKNSVNRMRPNTASSRISTSASQHLLTQNANSYTDSNENFLSVHSKQSNDAFLSHSNNPSSGTLAKQRPLTASARFPSGDAQARQKILSKEDEVDVPIDDGDDEGHNDRVTEQNTLGVGEYMENYYDVPFISTDSGKELPLDTPHSNVAYDYQDFGSLNDTTLITADQDHTSYVTGPLTDSSNQAYNLLSPPGHYQNSAPVASKEWPGLIRPQVKFVQAQYSHPFSNSDVVNGVHHDDKMIGKGETGQAAQNKNEFETKNHACEIYDMSVQINYDQNQMSAIHQQQQALELRVKLNNISKQIILKLRNFLIEKHLKGAKIYDLFELFVQSGRLFFDSVDLLNALAKLNISTSLAVTNIVIMHLAIDGKDKVSYGEFKVFVTDVDHKILEKLVLGQLAFQLERQGRVYEQLFRTCMTDSAIEVKSSKFSSQMNQIPYTNYLQSSYEASRKIKNNGMIGALEFQNALLKLGLKLNAHDLDRLSVRFDIHGGGLCAVSRFIDMVEGSTQWKQALSKVRIQEEAVAEAHILREKLRSQENATGYDNNNLSTCGHAGSQVMPTNVITEELLAMAEYLGIRPITEEHMLWIAADALRAPLPVSWSMMTDSRGRIYFYNQISKQSRWEHPLDPHFRKLRDDYRSMDNAEKYNDGNVIDYRSTVPTDDSNETISPRDTIQSTQDSSTARPEYDEFGLNDQVNDYNGSGRLTASSGRILGVGRIRPRPHSADDYGYDSNFDSMAGLNSKGIPDSSIENATAANQKLKFTTDNWNLRPVSAPQNSFEKPTINSFDKSRGSHPGKWQTRINKVDPVELSLPNDGGKAANALLGMGYNLGDPRKKLGTDTIYKGAFSGMLANLNSEAKLSSGIGSNGNMSGSKPRSASRTRPNSERSTRPNVNTRSNTAESSTQSKVLGHGKSSNNLILSNSSQDHRSSQLAFMFEDDIIEKLDNVLLKNSTADESLGKGNLRNQQTQQQQRRHRK